MPERSYASPVYRYGFNGKENDNEVKGEGNQQDYGFRISDPRLGRFLSVDPLTKSFPELTPYQYASNSPIVNIDLDGEEGMWYIFAKCGVFGQTTANIANGTEAGIKASVTKTYTFVTSDMWKASTWESAANAFGTLCDITVGNMDGRNDQLAYNVIQPKVDNFKKEVINGDAYSRSKYISEVGADILTAYIGSKGLSALKSSAMGMARGSLASSFYAESGYTAESALQHMEGINFAKPVQTTTLAKGTVVQQWVGENGVGNYFTPLENGASQNLGMPDYAKRTLKQFTLTEDVKVLKSTAADYKGNAGGGTQYFSTELKVKIKPN